MESNYFIGIDVGTQGARVVLMGAQGQLAGAQETAFDLTADSRQEQDPAVWWTAVISGLRALIQQAKKSGISPEAIRAMSVTSTSGTIVPLKANHQPLYPAIMYSDPRQAEAGRLCKEMAMRHHPESYHGFNASSGLSKMVWFVNSFPDLVPDLESFAHATDFIIGRLSDCWNLTDETNVLKSGYDLAAGCWPAYLTEFLPLRASWLPRVVPSGKSIGHLQPSVAESIGIPAGQAGRIVVTAGMTDGCASQVASGAVRPGNWNTTIGTTLVIKGVTKKPIVDPLDRLYNHHHPEGYWMPGGASNTGADWVSTHFADQLSDLEKAASSVIPTGSIIYPLMQQGERFPFMAEQARGFGWDMASGNDLQRFAGGMEGVAYIEKMAYHMIRKLSGESIDQVYTAGGASNSSTWLRIRSSVLQLPICKMEQVSGAVGAAILAASGTHFGNLTEAVAKMTKVERQYFPETVLASAYESGYRRFIKALADKEYINPADYLT